MRLVGEHAALQDALGVAPSIHAAYRFTVKLREHSATLADCLDHVLAGLREAIPDLGTNLAIDGSDLPAISTLKGGGFYGYKLHAVVCTKTDLPIAWRAETACDSEHEHMPSLLDTRSHVTSPPVRVRWIRGTTGPASMRPASPATCAPSSR